MSSIDQLWILAFIVAPVLAVAWGKGLVFLHQRSMRKHRNHPAE